MTILFHKSFSEFSESVHLKIDADSKKAFFARTKNNYFLTKTNVNFLS